MKKITTLLAACIAASSILGSAQAAIIVNSVDWTVPGIPAQGVLTNTNNITITSPASINTGQFFTFDWGTMPFASGYDTTFDDAVAIGATPGTSTTTITFSETINELSLWFNYTDNLTTYDFTGLTWTFIGGNNASPSGNTVVSTGDDNETDGFLINVSGSFGPSTSLSFDVTNGNALDDTAGFTLSTPVPPSAVPEPGQVAASLLLLIGLGTYVLLKRRKAAKIATPA